MIPIRRMAVYSTTAMRAARSGHAMWALVALLSGCASGAGWVYEKPRTTPAQLDHDKTLCRKAAPSRSLFRTFQAEKLEREGFNRCMEKLGYTVKEVPAP
jgi:hypothetical protein